MKALLLAVFAALLATGAFAQQTGSGGGGSFNAAAPPPIGNTTPNTGAFTTLSGVVAVPINAQSGTTYTVATADQGKLVTASNASPVAVTLPQAGSAGFLTGWSTTIENVGAGAATITPTTSTIDGAATFVLQQGTGVAIFSDGTNYQVFRGNGGVSLSAANVFSGTSNQFTNVLRLGSTDAGLSRAGASSVEVGNGTTGDASGAFIAGNFSDTNNFVSLRAGLGGFNAVRGHGLYFEYSATTAGISPDAFFFSPAAAKWQIGAADAAAPVAQTLVAQSVVAGTSNTAGVDLTIGGSAGTGTGAGGKIILKTAVTGTTGTAQNAEQAVFTLDTNQHAQFSSAAIPTIGTCGTGSPAITAGSTDVAGEATIGTTATACTITFKIAYAAAPFCVVQDKTATVRLLSYTISTTAIVLTMTSNSGDVVEFVCHGA